MREVDAAFAKNYLRATDVDTFWSEIGGVVNLPEDFEYLYEDGIGLFVIEPADGFCGIHAAVSCSGRGMGAVRAGTEAISIGAKRHKRVLARVQRQHRAAQTFATLCGMKRYSFDDSHIYYEATPCL